MSGAREPSRYIKYPEKFFVSFQNDSSKYTVIKQVNNTGIFF